MGLSGLPHRVLTSLQDGSANWEWLKEHSFSDEDAAGHGLDVADGVLAVDESELNFAATGTLTGQNQAGVANTLARSDHDHALPNLGTYFSNPIAGAVASAAPGADSVQYVQVFVPHRATLTGVGYYVGATSSGNVRCALYNSAGTKVADRTTNAAQATANSFQKVAFDSTYATPPGYYFAALVLSSGTATWYVGSGMSPAGAVAGPGGGATAVSITPPTTPVITTTPAMTTY